MQIKRTTISDTEVTLTVVASQAELESMKQHVVSHFRSRVKIAGFREGKAPLELIEKNVDPAQLQSEFLEETINQFYGQAIREEKLRPVANPEVNVKKFVPYTTLEFEAKLAVIGDIKMPDYTKLRKTKPKTTVSSDDIKQILKDLQARAAEKKDVDRAAKLGDQVLINFKGVDSKGEAIAGADGKDYPLTLGDNSFIPGFEDNVVGMKPGDVKSFDLTFPADYHSKQLAKKKVNFTVTATRVQEVVTAQLDDKFASTVGPFKTLQGLKDDIKKQLNAERQNEADRRFESDIVGELADKTKVALPKQIVDEQIQKIEDQERQNLVYRGQTWEEHLKEEGVTEEQHKEQKRPEAEKGLRASLLLAEIADKEGLDISSEELELRLQLLRGQYQDPQMQEELNKPENKREIASRILTEKTLAKLVDYATKN